MQYIKFGFGRCIRDASRMIQNKVISRKKALYYVKKYDHEKPSEYFKEQLEYLNKKEFNEIVDSHRNSEIWNFKTKMVFKVSSKIIYEAISNHLYCKS